MIEASFMSLKSLMFLRSFLSLHFLNCAINIINFSGEKYVNSQKTRMITLSLKKKRVAKFASIEKLVSLQARKNDFGCWITIIYSIN